MAREVVIVVLLVTAASLISVDAGQRARQVSGAYNAAHRQIQQFQIGLQLPPGTQVHQGNVPPPARPGFVWVQVPATSPPGQQGPQHPPPQHPPPQHPPPQHPPPQLPGGDTFVTPPPPSYPATQVPPHPGNLPISDFETDQFPSNQLGPGQETGAEPPNPLLQHCQAARGQFANPSSCSSFINCWDDTVAEQQCPGGLMFNVAGFCDYAENVDCSDRGGPDNAPSMEENAVCPTPYGAYRSKDSCGIFYICNNGIPFKFDCPAGLNYNTDLGVCDYPYNVDCRGTPSERPIPENPEIPDYEVPEENFGGGELPPPDPVTGEGEKHKYYGGFNKVPANVVDSRVPCRSNSVFRLNPSCSSVSICMNGRSTVVNCTPGTAWDSRAQKCINIYKARC